MPSAIVPLRRNDNALRAINGRKVNDFNATTLSKRSEIIILLKTKYYRVSLSFYPSFANAFFTLNTAFSIFSSDVA